MRQQEVLHLLTRELSQARSNGDSLFNAVQNARVVAGAEQYYRMMYYGSTESWNLRDMHMFQTLKQTMDHVGPDARAVKALCPAISVPRSQVSERYSSFGNLRDCLINA
ncbi:erythromycin esterase family protein [Sulfitobacter sp. TBRI5]|uniref:erythromycin esterase family protein n=1 Tax=Sulfitobacter sp. TBRI5 TaxID=2989732 RepID=UPI003D9B95CC